MDYKKLIPIVEEILKRNSFMDSQSITNYIKDDKKFGYSRHKTNSLNFLVQKALQAIKKKELQSDLNKIISDQELMDEDDLVEYKDENICNKEIRNRYMNNSAGTPPQIEISSEPQNYERYDDNLLKENISDKTNGSANKNEEERIIKNKTPRKRKQQNSHGDKKSGKKQKKRDSIDENISAELSLEDEFEFEEVSDRLEDMAGIEKPLEKVAIDCYCVLDSHYYANMEMPNQKRGLLLYGPGGCGKTMFGRALAGSMKLPLMYLEATRILHQVKSQSEKRLRRLFEICKEKAPCVLFIDNIHTIAKTPENEGLDRRILDTLASCMTEMKDRVLVIGATNKLESIDLSIRQPGRFDHEIAMVAPDRAARLKVLNKITQKLQEKRKILSDVDMEKIAYNTVGYTSSDLKKLVEKSLDCLVKRCVYKKAEVNPDNSTNKFNFLVEHSKDGQNLFSKKLEMQDFDSALKEVVGSLKKEGFGIVPDVTWDDIGALDHVRKKLQNYMNRAKYPEVFEKIGMSSPSGILMYGPPGCGKTLVAKAVANDAGIGYIDVKGPELLNKYVGESERSVREIFQRARDCEPCLIFFDEFDALCPERSSSDKVMSRVVNQMLTELDGSVKRGQVFVLAATNKPDLIDKAVTRSGRISEKILIDRPTYEARCKILQTITKNKTKPPMEDSVDLDEVARKCPDTFTGADLKHLVDKTSEFCLDMDQVYFEGKADIKPVKMEHFEQSLKEIIEYNSKKSKKSY